MGEKRFISHHNSRTRCDRSWIFSKNIRVPDIYMLIIERFTKELFSCRNRKSNYFGRKMVRFLVPFLLPAHLPCRVAAIFQTAAKYFSINITSDHTKIPSSSAL